MLVGNLASTNYFSSANLAKLRESKTAGGNSVRRTDYGHSDSYVPSDGIKAKNLAEVKSRITAGFYNSTEVNEDLTEFFSNVFKKALA